VALGGGFDGAGGDGPQTCECGDGGPEAEPQDGDEGLAGEAEVDGWRLVGAGVQGGEELVPLRRVQAGEGRVRPGAGTRPGRGRAGGSGRRVQFQSPCQSWRVSGRASISASVTCAPAG
jgi:hypothetical protein